MYSTTHNCKGKQKHSFFFLFSEVDRWLGHWKSLLKSEFACKRVAYNIRVFASETKKAPDRDQRIAYIYPSFLKSELYISEFYCTQIQTQRHKWSYGKTRRLSGKKFDWHRKEVRRKWSQGSDSQKSERGRQTDRQVGRSVIGFYRAVNRFGYIWAKHNSSNHTSKSFHSSRDFAIFVWWGFGKKWSRTKGVA